MRSNRRYRTNPSDSRRYYDWLDRAAEDLMASERLLSDDMGLNPSAFHCQQAIEKALKAYILLRTGRLLDGHNLTFLCRQAAKEDKSFRQWLDESADLNRWYIESRYPSDLPFQITDKQARRAVAMAQEMYLFICGQVDEELDRRERIQQPKKSERGESEY